MATVVSGIPDPSQGSVVALRVVAPVESRRDSTGATTAPPQDTTVSAGG